MRYRCIELRRLHSFGGGRGREGERVRGYEVRGGEGGHVCGYVAPISSRAVHLISVDDRSTADRRIVRDRKKGDKKKERPRGRD